MNHETLSFSAKILEINEIDYGDFMRRGNCFLNDLIEHLGYLNDKDINHKLNKMRNYLQFCPNWDVEKTRDALIHDTKYIDEILMGHQQDWES